ncbi:MAG TPA: alpha/beta hydrolase, partial [Steroidobacteraceae bacterium]|nr:alpha/beta hydrolase [Steroidobacteraceae bacterium]
CPSIVVASRNDPYGTLDFARGCAQAWGSRFVDIGDAGHINAASGLGDWAAGHELLGELVC